MTAKNYVSCPKCGEKVIEYRNPKPTVDIIIEMEGGGIILIHRANEPKVWAIPGGYVDWGETVETAAAREAKEETGLDVYDLKQFHVYSDPERDERSHNISITFTAKAKGEPKAASDADDIGIFTQDSLPQELGFDHPLILADYFKSRHQR